MCRVRKSNRRFRQNQSRGLGERAGYRFDGHQSCAVKILCAIAAVACLQVSARADLVLTDLSGADDFVLADAKSPAAIFVETNDDRAAQIDRKSTRLNSS